MRFPGSLHQSMRHQRAGRDDGVDDSPIDQLSDDQPLFGDRHRAGQGHDHEAVLVAGHGFEDVDGLTQLPAGECGLGHGAHQVVDRMHFPEIERLQWNQPVLDWIVQMALHTGAVMIVMFQVAPPACEALLY